MSNELLDYGESAKRWQNYGVTYLNEARSYFSEVNRTVLTIGTFLLGFIGIFIQVGDMGSESDLNKFLLIASFISITLSIVLGVWIFVKMNIFLNRSGSHYERLSERLSMWMIKNNRNSGKKYPKEIFKGKRLVRQPSNNVQYLQFSFLSLGFIFIAIYFIFHVVSGSRDKNEERYYFRGIRNFPNSTHSIDRDGVFENTYFPR